MYHWYEGNSRRSTRQALHDYSSITTSTMVRAMQSICVIPTKTTQHVITSMQFRLSAVQVRPCFVCEQRYDTARTKVFVSCHRYICWIAVWGSHHKDNNLLRHYYTLIFMYDDYDDDDSPSPLLLPCEPTKYILLKSRFNAWCTQPPFIIISHTLKIEEEVGKSLIKE